MLKHLCVWLGYNLLVPTKLAPFLWGRGEGCCVFSKRWASSWKKKKKKGKYFSYGADASPMSVIAPNQCACNRLILFKNSSSSFTIIRVHHGKNEW